MRCHVDPGGARTVRFTLARRSRAHVWIMTKYRLYRRNTLRNPHWANYQAWGHDLRAIRWAVQMWPSSGFPIDADVRGVDIDLWDFAWQRLIWSRRYASLPRSPNR